MEWTFETSSDQNVIGSGRARFRGSLGHIATCWHRSYISGDPRQHVNNLQRSCSHNSSTVSMAIHHAQHQDRVATSMWMMRTLKNWICKHPGEISSLLIWITLPDKEAILIPAVNWPIVSCPSGLAGVYNPSTAGVGVNVAGWQSIQEKKPEIATAVSSAYGLRG